MPNFVTAVNFGSGNAGLSTVGYTIYKEDETIQQARTTDGVSELGISTGIYRATITYPQNFKGFILWDTGTGTPRYASESVNPADADSVADEVRTMLRSLNTSLSSHLERLFKRINQKQEPDKELLDSVSELKNLVGSVNDKLPQKIEVQSVPVNLKPVQEKIDLVRKDIIESRQAVLNKFEKPKDYTDQFVLLSEKIETISKQMKDDDILKSFGEMYKNHSLLVKETASAGEKIISFITEFVGKQVGGIIIPDNKEQFTAIGSKIIQMMADFTKAHDEVKSNFKKLDSLYNNELLDLLRSIIDTGEVSIDLIRDLLPESVERQNGARKTRDSLNSVLIGLGQK